MRDDLYGLRALLCVAQKKSFTAAAAELRVSPSAVSQTVRSLEDRVGVRLLARTTRSVGLTEAGAQFVARLQPALGQIDDAFDVLRRSSQQLNVKLREVAQKLTETGELDGPAHL